MQTVTDAIQLLRRQAELEGTMRTPGGVRISEEQELILLRRRLAELPEAIRAVLQAAHALGRPAAEVTSQDVESWAIAGTKTQPN